MGAVARPDASLTELIGELTLETAVLVRQEVQLASAEMGVKARDAARDARLTILGGAVAQAGFVTVLLAVAFALAEWIPLWLSALLMGAIALLGGTSLALLGLAALKRLDPIPTEAVEALRADRAWLKERLR